MLWCFFLADVVSTVTHSAWQSRIGPSHVLTLAAWNITHLWAVVYLCYVPHWSANGPYLKYLLLQKKVNQNCCQQMRFLGSQCLKNALAAGLCCPGHRWRSLQRSPNLLTGFEKDALRRKREKEKKCERTGERRGRRGEGKVEEGMGGERQGWKRGEKRI